MNDGVDRYDVEDMIRRELGPLRSRILELESALRELRNDLGSERVDRQDADESLQRMINSRTEHLV